MKSLCKSDSDGMEGIYFCNIQFKGLKKRDILLSDLPFQQVVTVGAEFIIEANRNQRFKSILNENVSTFDGQIPFLLAKRKYSKVDFEKISGADFIYDICEMAKKNKERIFLLGGYAESNELSVKIMTEMGISAAGFAPGFIPYPFPSDRLESILDMIKTFAPRYLFVGLGMGKQEYFISENRKILEAAGVRLAIGCGGTLEVFSGRLKRAPKWMQKAGLEGLYRLLAEPSLKRLKRLASTVSFLKYI